MKQLLSTCPTCQGQLRISALKCPDCGLELRNDFELSPFEQLSNDQYIFLMNFLKNRGNLKNLQNELQISYPTAKKKLDEVLAALGFTVNASSEARPEVIDMRNMMVDRSSKKASEIIKAKLMDNGGHITVYTLRGLPCEVWADSDGKSFISDKLPIKPPYTYDVFDIIVDLLSTQGGSARKGNGRNYRLGEPECDETTVVGAVAKYYNGKQNGESVFDPVFVFSAILEWAGIARNDRGELVLNAAYRSTK